MPRSSTGVCTSNRHIPVCIDLLISKNLAKFRIKSSWIELLRDPEEGGSLERRVEAEPPGSRRDLPLTPAMWRLYSRRPPESPDLTLQERLEQERVVRGLRRDAAVLAGHFRLPLRDLRAEQPRVKRRYGICYADGTIRIRLRHATTGQLLKYSSLVDTLCHELAHLRHFDHGPRFRSFYQRILAHARRADIYRPAPRIRGVAVGPTASARPAAVPLRRQLQGVQLELFPSDGGERRGS
jgi:hypothetical protein